MDNRSAAVVPSGEQNTAFAAMMLDVLELAHHERNAAEAAAEADESGPCTVRIR